MKPSAFILSISAAVLAVASLGLTAHVQAKPHAPSLHAEKVLATSTGDADVLGVIGDVLVEGCNTNSASCSKAWQDLGSLATKDAL